MSIVIYVLFTQCPHFYTTLPNVRVKTIRPHLTPYNHHICMGSFFTREDPYNIHKTLGALAVFHYAYLFTRFPFQETSIERYPGRVCMHILLSVSSLQFRVPLKRSVGERPMIWKEFRLHNIAFALRSFVCVLMFSRDIRLKWTCIFFTMTVADLITYYTGSFANKTMRSMPTPVEWGDADYAVLQRLYAQSQFGATMACFHSPDMAMLVSMPVQVSSFLMTLVRKSLLTPQMWHVAYSLSLWSVYFVVSFALLFRDISELDIYIYSALAFRVRCTFRINKYILWSITLLAASYRPIPFPLPVFRVLFWISTVWDAVRYKTIFHKLKSSNRATSIHDQD